MDPVMRHVELPQGERQAEPPLAQLVGRLSEDLQQLARREAQLAKHELSESLDRAKQQVAALVLGGAALAAGFLTLLGAAVAALALAMPAWAAACLVGGTVSLIGAVLFLSARAQLARVSFAPGRAIQGVQDDVSAIKRAAT